ncbi:MAG: hypothetical protein U5K54_06565 [Cytophagales bacterium]|nr:hypothetical protein [Cytophagales bacterium]
MASLKLIDNYRCSVETPIALLSGSRVVTVGTTTSGASPVVKEEVKLAASALPAISCFASGRDDY